MHGALNLALLPVTFWLSVLQDYLPRPDQDPAIMRQFAFMHVDGEE